MCFSSGTNEAAKAQQRQAKQRDQAINEATKQVRAIFDNPARQQQIGQYKRAVKKRGTIGLDKAFNKNNRKLKFAMARSGLTGGSADVDLHDRLNDQYARGLLKVLSRAKQAASGLRASDAASEARLLSEVASGYGLGGANTSAVNALRSNLQGAQAAVAPQSFDQLFGNMAKIYNQSQINKGRRQAEKAGLGTFFNNVGGRGGSKY